MIFDKLENLKLYDVIPHEAIEFMASEDIACGKYILSDKVYINVEEYNTKMITDARFEAHKDYIDVQIVLFGKEELYYTNITDLTVEVPYSKERDIMFYSNSVEGANRVVLDGTNFIILYPQDAHAPQVAYENNSGKVKKAVIKSRM